MNTGEPIPTAAVARLALAMACIGPIVELQPISGSAEWAGDGGPVATKRADSASPAASSANVAMRKAAKHSPTSMPFLPGA
jgi:hypothetical protein